METKVNFALVGGFVVALSVALVAAVLWISSSRSSRKETATYVAYFEESVSGLNPRAPVKYKGVVVGSVQRIELDPEDPERVRLELAIERDVPIRQDTVAVLSVQGLTGIAFLDLEGGTRDAPLLEPSADGGPPAIATRPSLFRRLDTSTTGLLSDLSRTAQSVNDLLDAQTRASLHRAIEDLEVVLATVARRSEAIDASLVDASRAIANGARASERLDDLVGQVARSAAAVERAAASVAKAGESARAGFDRVERFGTDALPGLQSLIVEARHLTASLSTIARELERDPSALVLGRRPPPPGPGE
ncbi:hypothetical protein MYXO_01505 [Myxococcaceae bacterium]|jgi:phospholipid/cholesterol/gamma-HCH transport system substrate-binding protein|nr:hypothetical protein MYXO_01505 [Myxococcaceae bacterium]